jgi:Amino acid kinase family
LALIVQKYGGSSVGDAAKIKHVANRVIETQRAGNQVVVVVSAMGDTTDELLDLANQVTENPAPRELDMLLTSGERISMALLALAINAAGASSRSFTGSQAGIITDEVHGNARIAEVTPDRIQEALNAGDIAIVAGFQGFNRETRDITTLPTFARSTRTSMVFTPPTLARFRRPKNLTTSMLSRCSSWLQPGQRFCTFAPLSLRVATTLTCAFVQRSAPTQAQRFIRAS